MLRDIRNSERRCPDLRSGRRLSTPIVEVRICTFPSPFMERGLRGEDKQLFFSQQFLYQHYLAKVIMTMLNNAMKVAVVTAVFGISKIF